MGLESTPATASDIEKISQAISDGAFVGLHELTHQSRVGEKGELFSYQLDLKAGAGVESWEIAPVLLRQLADRLGDRAPTEIAQAAKGRGKSS